MKRFERLSGIQAYRTKPTAVARSRGSRGYAATHHGKMRLVVCCASGAGGGAHRGGSAVCNTKQVVRTSAHHRDKTPANSCGSLAGPLIQPLREDTNAMSIGSYSHP